jgi:serine/threonine protein kinase
LADRASGRRVVVKHVPLDGDEEDVRTALNEVEALKSLSHPNIVRCFGSWVMPGGDGSSEPWSEGSELARLPMSKALEAWTAAKTDPSISMPSLNILTEYIDGGSLDKLILRNKDDGPFEEDLLGVWLAQLILAIDHMHKRRLLHRDIKVIEANHTSEEQ